MRLGKRERRDLRLSKRFAKAAAKRAAPREGATSIEGSLATAIPSQGASKPGANLFRLEKAKDKPKYSIDRQPRLSSRPVKTETKKRFAQA